jgi:hypothetical protein
MNSFDQCWTRLTTAAREAAAGEVVSAPAGAWVTRVAALGRAELARVRGTVALSAWALPGFGVALMIAVVAVAVLSTTSGQPEGTAELIALADPLGGNSLLP